MVTGSDGDQNAQNGAGAGKTPMPKLMSLLPVSYKRSDTRLLKRCHFLGCASPACTCSLINNLPNAATYTNKYTYSLPGYFNRRDNISGTR